MLLVLGAVLGLLLGLAAGGSLRNLSAVRLGHPWIPLAALLVKELSLYTAVSGTWVPLILYPLSQVLLAGWCGWHARRLPGAVVVAAGIAMNVIVIAANGGRMPVAPALAHRGPAALVETGHYAQYVLAGRGTRLDPLGDWIALPGALFRLFPQAYSPGDLVSCLGIALVLFLATRRGAPAAITTR